MELEAERERLQSDKSKLESTILLMRDEMMRLRRTIFGRSSERFIKSDPNQLILDFDGEAQLQQELEYLQAQAAAKVFILHHPKKNRSILCVKRFRSILSDAKRLSNRHRCP